MALGTWRLVIPKSCTRLARPYDEVVLPEHGAGAEDRRRRQPQGGTQLCLLLWHAHRRPAHPVAAPPLRRGARVQRRHAGAAGHVGAQQHRLLTGGPQPAPHVVAAPRAGRARVPPVRPDRHYPGRRRGARAAGARHVGHGARRVHRSHAVAPVLLHGLQQHHPPGGGGQRGAHHRPQGHTRPCCPTGSRWSYGTARRSSSTARAGSATSRPVSGTRSSTSSAR